ncbi:hypothetical protein NIES4071_10590 [Calothrix sp. NIES-4071]|nr:hypothetical protein NIES4071_10590 [Calothrix sp. NIES-4071]BAZ55400.1 hypothetical protein NIES4105_10550 [Calothrix sp. NIES-4105]
MSSEQTVLEVKAAEITKSFLEDLEKLSYYSGEPMAAVYADSLLRRMRDMLDRCIGDPYTEVVMALHDALAFQNRWIDYTREQYQGAYNLFLSLVNQETISDTEVENSILALDDLGFDIMPFGVQLEDNAQEDEKDI